MAYSKGLSVKPQLGSRTIPESQPDLSGRLMDSGGGKNMMYSTNKKKQLFKKLQFATWNVRTLLDSKNVNTTTTPRRTAIVAAELKRYNVDIAALQETHMADFGRLDERGSGYSFYWSGSSESSNMHGVAICVRTELIRKEVISEPTCINERLMTIDIV